MLSVLALRDEIRTRSAAGASQDAIAAALGVSRWKVRSVLQTPEEVEPAAPEEEPPAVREEPTHNPAPPEAEPLSAAQALAWLEAHAERVQSQANAAYAPWHTLHLVRELSAILVAVVKEIRHHAHD